MTVKSLLFLLQKLNFTDQFYAPPVVMVTAERVNNDSHLSGGNAITAWVEVRKETDWSTAYFTPVQSEGFLKNHNHTSSVILFYKGIIYFLNKIFTRKNNMKKKQQQQQKKNRQLDIRSKEILNSEISVDVVSLTVFVSRIFCVIFQTVLDSN